MKTSAISDSCLTYDQLHSYVSGKSDNEECSELHKHVSTCELCTYAVSGFTVVPFEQSDITEINNQIDILTTTPFPKQISFVNIFIASVSIILIFGFYRLADSFSKNKTKVTSIEKSQLLSVAPPNQESAISNFENSVVEKKQKQGNVIENKLQKNTTVSVEPIKSINAGISAPPAKPADEILQPDNNQDVIYIHDLKVADYNILYFKPASGHVNFGRNTPSFNENKNMPKNESGADIEQIITLEKVLKRGLGYFNKGKYDKSIDEFQLLLDSNPNDINALFYSAMAFYQTGKYNSSIKNFNAVLNSSNSVFHPEAKWNLALVYIKTGEKQTAKQLLLDIAAEKGFYAKVADEKLKTLK